MLSVLIIGLVIAVLFMSAAFVTRISVGRMARQRAGEGFSDFAAYFVHRNIPHQILSDTYQYFGQWNASAGELFPVRPTDNISDVYGCVDEDLEDAVGEILQKSGRRPFTQAEMPQPPRIETVEDVVRYVAAAPVVPFESKV
ncbi:MAG TPA: hypothetical protein VGO96_12280 [Pyrinomonadaceae bacterium]|jgi:hypothetical protein|nr:hypothetical protein [Pyrinomonadaceae bacterium]